MQRSERHADPPRGPDIPRLAVGYTVPDNPFGLPVRTADADGRVVWDPGVEWTGGGLASTSRDLARWGHLLFTGQAMDAPYLDRLLDGVPVAPDAPGILYGAGVAIYAGTPRGQVYGHGGWIPAYVSSLRRYADYRVIHRRAVLLGIGGLVPAGYEPDALTMTIPFGGWRDRIGADHLPRAARPA